jgi:hypothetical protein
MTKNQAITDIDEIRKQLKNNHLKGDAVLTLKWLLDEYDNMVYDYQSKLDDIYYDHIERDERE